MKSIFRKTLLFVIIAIAVIGFEKAFASASVIIIPQSEVTIYQPDTSFNPDWNASATASTNYLNNSMIPAYNTSTTTWFFCSSGTATLAPACGGNNASAGMLTGGVPWYATHPTAIRANNTSQVGTSGQPYYTCYVETNYHCIPLQNNGGTVTYYNSAPPPSANEFLSYTINGLSSQPLNGYNTPVVPVLTYKQDGTYNYVRYTISDVDDPALNVEGTVGIAQVATSSSTVTIPSNGMLKAHKYNIIVNFQTCSNAYVSCSQVDGLYTISDVITFNYDPNGAPLPDPLEIGQCSLTSGQGVSQCFHNIYNVITSKIPFSYIFEIKEIMNDLSSSPAQSLPAIQTTFMGSQLTLFSQTTFFSFISPANQSLIKNLITAILWFSFAFIIFRKITSLFNRSHV